MQAATIIIALGAALAAALLTALVRSLALARGVLDIPNERSSHSRATPRGGGISIAVAAALAVSILALRGAVPRELLLVFLGGGTVVAAVGFADDHYNIPAAPRLAVHLLAAAWAVYWLGGLESVRIGGHIVHLGWAGTVLATLGIVWFLNLFNFMDGIDGIAASEAIFIAAGGALLSPGAAGVAAAGSVFAACCGGFLLWNWPPAKIFLGDVGSGYLGYVIAVLALAATHDNPVAGWVWLILGGVFFVDATLTLLRRLRRGERVYQAHRSHAYQHLARRWGSHLRVTVAVLMVNVGWLLPCAALAAWHPAYAAVVAALAFVPLVALARAGGSGRGEFPER